MVPRAALPPAIPFTLQVTCEDALPAPDTDTVKTCAPLVGTVTATGATASAIVFSNVTAADADDWTFTTLVAVTVTPAADGRFAGAV